MNNLNNLNIVSLSQDKLERLLNEFSIKITQNCLKNLLNLLEISQEDLKNLILEKKNEKKIFLNLTKSADYLNISRTTLWRYIKQGKISLNEMKKINLEDLKKLKNI